MSDLNIEQLAVEIMAEHNLSERAFIDIHDKSVIYELGKDISVFKVTMTNDNVTAKSYSQVVGNLSDVLNLGDYIAMPEEERPAFLFIIPVFAVTYDLCDDKFFTWVYLDMSNGKPYMNISDTLSSIIHQRTDIKQEYIPAMASNYIFKSLAELQYMQLSNIERSENEHLIKTLDLFTDSYKPVTDTKFDIRNVSARLYTGGFCSDWPTIPDYHMQVLNINDVFKPIKYIAPGMVCVKTILFDVYKPGTDELIERAHLTVFEAQTLGDDSIDLSMVKTNIESNSSFLDPKHQKLYARLVKVFNQEKACRHKAINSFIKDIDKLDDKMLDEYIKLFISEELTNEDKDMFKLIHLTMTEKSDPELMEKVVEYMTDKTIDVYLPCSAMLAAYMRMVNLIATHHFLRSYRKNAHKCLEIYKAWNFE